MTSRQERKRLKVLEKRREEHEQYAAERLAKVNEICKLAWLNGMSYGQYMIERYQGMEENKVENTVETVENAENIEIPAKCGGRRPLTTSKIQQIEEMLADGMTQNAVAEAVGVSKSSVARIARGEFRKGKGRRKAEPKAKPEPVAAEPAVFTALEVSKNGTDDILRRLISEAKNNLSDVSAFEHCDCKEVGYAIGLLTAAEMILGDNAKI